MSHALTKKHASSFVLLLGLLCLIALAGCGDDADAAGLDGGAGNESVDGSKPRMLPPDVAVTSAALVSLPSCDDVDTAVRAAAKRAVRKLMRERLDETLAQLERNECWTYYGGFEDAGVSYAPTDDNAGGGEPTPPGSGPTSVSETNNQVKGVDEADFVKNDDGYIYVLVDGALQIVDAWPAADAHVVSRTPLENPPKRLFVAGDRALVFSSMVPEKTTDAPYDTWWYSRGECTYGYDCDFTGDGTATQLSFYDISDRAAPKLLRTLELSGSYLSARRIGSAVHMMVYDEPELLRTLKLTPQELVDDGPCTGKKTVTYEWGTSDELYAKESDAARARDLYADLERENVKAIDAAPLAQLVGSMSDHVRGEDAVERDYCHGFYDSPLADGMSLLSLVSLDLEDARSPQVSTIISRAGASYASGEAYYVSVRQSPNGGYWYEDLEDVDEASTIHKFAIGSNGNRYEASGLVKGHVLNQFAMDERDGNLRIATSNGHVPDPNTHSTLTILAQKDDELVQRGLIDDIAPHEDIRSVRFVGERGYVVTFKKTDPLFVFDLANADAPKILGELKIPGFSTYMHPLDAEHLLTIGFDAADQGSFAFFQGLQLQIFDVTDPTAPKLAHKEIIGTRGSTSEAATNHLAFAYFAARETLSVPVTVCEDSTGNGGDFGQTMTFSGVKLYHVTSADGFSLTGEVSHPYVDPYDGSGQYGVGAACSNWWTEARSMVKRTVFMDDFVYSISEQRIKVSDLRDLSHDVADVPLVD